MKEELLKTVNETLIKSINAVDQSISWMSGQIPDIIHQFLLWSIVSCSFYVILGLIISILSIFGIKKSLKFFDSSEEHLIPLGMCSFFGLFVGVLMILINVYKLLFIYVAPKIYVIKYTASLLK